MTAPVEFVVLLDDHGTQIGVADKATVHHRDTPLHLAFSCYVFDPDGRLLVTRRAESKRTWPCVWTNSLCGHPGPGERIPDAVRRRANDELGLELTQLRAVLPDFRYEATMTDGTRENEVCPVFAATTWDEVTANANEVSEWQWVSWTSFRDDVMEQKRAVSPWCVLQVAQLARLDRWPPAPTNR